jgi:hypothetical protein
MISCGLLSEIAAPLQAESALKERPGTWVAVKTPKA